MKNTRSNHNGRSPHDVVTILALVKMNTIQFNCCFRVLIVLLGLIPVARAANYTWDTVSGDGVTITTGSGTWNQTNVIWNNGSGNVAWGGTTNTAIFAGADGAYAITIGQSITNVNGVTFNNNGYTLSATSPFTISAASGGASQTITLGSGKTATISTNVTVSSLTGGGGYTISGAGTLNVGSGSSVLAASNAAIILASGNLVQMLGGATVNLNTNGVLNGTQLVVGNASGDATNNVAGGAVTIGSAYGSGTSFNIVLANNTSGTANGVLTISSGSVVNPSTNILNGLRFGSASAGTGTSFGIVNLNGGTLQVSKIFEGAGAGNTQTSTFNFNGGKLKVNQVALNPSLPAFMTGLDNANVKEGGAIIDPNGVPNVTIGQALVHGGVAATDGGLTVNDSAVTKGILTLTAANTYTGPTTITAGTLALDGGGTVPNTPSITVASGATLDVSASTLTTALTLGSGQTLKASATGANTTGTIKGLTTKILTVGAGGITFTAYGGSGTAPLTASGVAGAITLSSAPITINTTTALTGTSGGTAYTLIDTASSGTVSGSLASSTPTITGSGLAVGCTASVAITGGQLILTVTSGLTSTTTTIARHSGTDTNSTYGDALQFDVTVTGASPTGTVTVKDGGAGGTTLGTATLSGGSAVVTLTNLTGLSQGTHANIVAVYGGDSNNNSSTSSALSPSQVVGQMSITVTSVAALNKIFDGTTAATITGTLSGVLAGDVGNVTLVGTGTFSSSAVGGPYTVTASCTTGGSAGANYTINPQPSGLTASILNTGVWTNTVSGNWGTATNWTNNIIAVGADNTADFNQVDIVSNITLNLEAAKTIGNIIFGNTDANPNVNWVVSGANTLTLAGTSPTVTVNNLGTNKSATISSVIAGTSGLTKSGSGTLALSGANTYTGSTIVSGGTLQIQNATDTTTGSLGAVPGTPTPGNIVLNGGTLESAAGIAGLTVNASRGIGIGANGGTMRNNHNNNYVYNGIIADQVVSPGNLTIAAPGQGSFQMVFGGQSTFSGGSVIQGVVVVTASSTGSPGSVTSGPLGTGSINLAGGTLRATTSGDQTLANNITISADSTIPAPAPEKTLTLSGPVTLSGGTRMLTVNSGTNDPTKSLTITGVIGDGGNGYGFTKAGPGTLITSSANTYSGDTTINAGKLVLSGAGSIANSTNIIVSSGAILDVSGASFTLGSAQTLKGNGTIVGPTTVNGVIAPGSSIGTLTFSNSPTLNGALVMELNRTNSQTADKMVLTTGTLNFAGNLTVTNIGPTLASGDTFTLFNSSAYSGSFSTINLPQGGANHWLTGNLTVNGTVTYTNSAPTASNLAWGAVSGYPVTMTIIGGKHAPFDADGDSLTVSAVTQGTNGATISTDGTNINYTASSTFAGVDAFNYTVSDGLGGATTATVTMTVVADGEGHNRLSPASSPLGSGLVVLSYLGIPGYSYALDTTTNLAPPVIWSPVVTNIADTNGFILFTNTPTGPVNYFRTRYAP